MDQIIKQYNIKLVIVAIIGIQVKDRRKILQKISKFPVEVRIVASIEHLISGNFNLSQIKSVDVQDILGREPVTPDTSLLQRNVNNKNVLITGAGGSIG